jgi:hypothetical protein
MEASSHYDPFAVVLGTRRGKQVTDTLLSHKPTESGREELGVYIAEMRDDADFESTLALLSNQHALIPKRPLLKELAAEFCRYLVVKSSQQFDDEVRRFLDGTAVYPSFGGHLLRVTDQRPKLSGQSAAQTRSIHVWAAGNTLGPIACLEQGANVICGLEITKAAWSRVQRGSWTADNLTALNWKQCAACERECPETLRYVLKETARYVPFGAELYKRMSLSIRTRTVEYLAAGEFATTEEAERIADNAYREMILPAAVTYATRSGEAAVQWVLEERPWRALRRAHGSDISHLLSADDWREALSPCVPQVIDEELVVASNEDFERARALIGARLEERAR